MTADSKVATSDRLKPYRFKVDQFDRMIAAGIFGARRGSSCETVCSRSKAACRKAGFSKRVRACRFIKCRAGKLTRC